MKKTVAVDDSLSPIKRTLEREGYSITRMGDIKADAIIVSGIDDNFMGMEDVMQNIPIINAQGKTAEQIVEELKAKL
ncbi:MAG TPA: YkuS family protein [Thermoanaerobacterales bacterium]|nr:YkuS family protein [Thermoanaerobacterales bacterium]